MTDMMINPAAARTQFTRPETAAPARIPVRGELTGPAAGWQPAKTVLVTRTTGPRQLVSVPRLVLHVVDNGLAFRTSSYSIESEQLAHDSHSVRWAWAAATVSAPAASRTFSRTYSAR